MITGKTVEDEGFQLKGFLLCFFFCGGGGVVVGVNHLQIQRNFVGLAWKVCGCSTIDTQKHT